MSFPIGKPHILKIDGALGATTVYVRPPSGIEWILVYLYFAHNNVDDETGYWYCYDTDLVPAGVALEGTTLSTSEKLYFPSYDKYGQAPNPMFKLTNDCYLGAYSTVDGDKYIYIRGLYIERPENFDLLVEEFKAYAGKYRLPISSRE